MTACRRTADRPRSSRITPNASGGRAEGDERRVREAAAALADPAARRADDAQRDHDRGRGAAPPPDVGREVGAQGEQQARAGERRNDDLLTRPGDTMPWTPSTRTPWPAAAYRAARSAATAVVRGAEDRGPRCPSRPPWGSSLSPSRTRRAR